VQLPTRLPYNNGKTSRYEQTCASEQSFLRDMHVLALHAELGSPLRARLLAMVLHFPGCSNQHPRV
jgi:hypothetical protein